MRGCPQCPTLFAQIQELIAEVQRLRAEIERLSRLVQWLRDRVAWLRGVMSALARWLGEELEEPTMRRRELVAAAVLRLEETIVDLDGSDHVR